MSCLFIPTETSPIAARKDTGIQGSASMTFIDLGVGLIVEGI